MSILKLFVDTFVKFLIEKGGNYHIPLIENILVLDFRKKKKKKDSVKAVQQYSFLIIANFVG